VKHFLLGAIAAVLITAHYDADANHMVPAGSQRVVHCTDELMLLVGRNNVIVDYARANASVRSLQLEMLPCMGLLDSAVAAYCGSDGFYRLVEVENQFGGHTTAVFRFICY